jgi:asparagine synthase (glutamine-hydrolysing)
LDHAPKGLSKPELVEALYLAGGLLHGWRRLEPDRSAPIDQVVLYDICDTYQIGASAARSTYHPSFADRLGESRASEWCRVERPWAAADLLIMRLLLRSYLLENGLAQSDRLSMTSSVELRLPLLDYKLVELVVGLQKVAPSYSLPSKAWFRAAVSDIVPKWVLDRPKRGFNPPVTPWITALKGRYGKDLGSGYLTESRVLDAEAARRLMTPGSRFGVRNDLAFKYLTLEAWCRAMSGCRADYAGQAGPGAARRVN